MKLETREDKNLARLIMFLLETILSIHQQKSPSGADVIITPGEISTYLLERYNLGISQQGVKILLDNMAESDLAEKRGDDLFLIPLAAAKIMLDEAKKIFADASLKTSVSRVTVH